MKVLFFLSNISLRGGTERSCISVCNELAENGYEVHIFSVGGDIHQPAFPLNKNIKVAGMDIQSKGVVLRLKLPYIIFKLSAYLIKNKISQLINVEIMSCLFTFPFLFKKRKFNYIVWEHFNYKVDLGLKQRRFFRKLVASKADVIVTLTHSDKIMWQENLSPKAKIFTIYNPSPFALSEKPYQFDSKSIIAVGRFTYQKGYDLLVDSWKILQLKNSKSTTGWKLSIIGDGEDKSSIQAQIQTLGIGDTVDLLANTNTISPYYEQAAFLCMSSRFEGLPMVLIEAQSYALPVVAFDCTTGPADIIVEGSGYLCTPLNTEGLANGMLKMIQNTEERKKMSEKAKELASRFLPKEVYKSWDAMFQGL